MMTKKYRYLLLSILIILGLVFLLYARSSRAQDIVSVQRDVLSITQYKHSVAYLSKDGEVRDYLTNDFIDSIIKYSSNYGNPQFKQIVDEFYVLSNHSTSSTLYSSHLEPQRIPSQLCWFVGNSVVYYDQKDESFKLFMGTIDISKLNHGLLDIFRYANEKSKYSIVQYRDDFFIYYFDGKSAFFTNKDKSHTFRIENGALIPDQYFDILGDTIVLMDYSGNFIVGDIQTGKTLRDESYVILYRSDDYGVYRNPILLKENKVACIHYSKGKGRIVVR